jgi:hypothetical protein
MGYFFKRLEKYIDVRPSAAMTDIIVQIMVEVLSIIGIVTKEIGQGKLSMSFRVGISYIQVLTFVQKGFLRSWRE